MSRPVTPDLAAPPIANDEAFVDIVKKLSTYVTQVIVVPSTWEQLRTTPVGNGIRVLTDHIVRDVDHPAILSALLILKWHFASLDPDDRGLNETRANACEIVAWRFLTHLSERDAIEYCLYELPPIKEAQDAHDSDSIREAQVEDDERATLLPRHRHSIEQVFHSTPIARRQRLMTTITESNIFENQRAVDDEDDPTEAFIGLNALEIAGVANAKKFLSQTLVQKIIYGMWVGEITLWDSLSVYSTKKPRFYNKGTADPFSRLRVPKYIKMFEVIFFASFLAIYYAVMIQRDPYRVTGLEILFYIWLAAFAYNELSEFVDAGLFYYQDFWSTWDLAIILNGLAFLITRIIGVAKDDSRIVDIAFDILSLEALFLIPRIFSLLSLHPYFGTLIPCLKAMSKDFIKFMAIVLILYMGFLTTFSLLARDTLTVSEMSWILIKVFFGGNYIGFEVMNKISPLLGPPLMIIFIILTQILLITSLISILSNSFSKVVAQAREEYLYVYSVYVLEASTSNRLTHFYPPLNLIPLILIRPLRIFVSASHIRQIRIVILKVTHVPIVGLIFLYEYLNEHFYGTETTFSGVGPNKAETPKAPRSFFMGRGPAAENVASPRAHRHYDGPAMTPSESFFAKPLKTRKSTGVMEEDRRALENKVEDLSKKIEELTALILAGQGSRESVVFPS